MFAVFCQPTASNPIGYAHVNKDGEFYSCTSKDCRAVKVKTKQLMSKKHLHPYPYVTVLPTDSGTWALIGQQFSKLESGGTRDSKNEVTKKI